MSEFQIVQIITAFLGTLGFTVLFNIRGVRLVVTALGGLFSWLLFVVFSFFLHNEVINYFLVALIISFYAEIMARIFKTPATPIFTTSLIPLIPGSSLYYTMASALNNDAGDFPEKAVVTLKLASALALGIIVASSATNIFFKIFNPIITKNQSKNNFKEH